MINLIILFIRALSQLLVLLVIVSVILSYFMDPYHPVRRGIDSVVEPMLSPIRRIVPLVDQRREAHAPRSHSSKHVSARMSARVRP